MKHEVALKWAEALESGQYEQGKSSLKTTRGYCCLGVLCEISGLGAWDAWDGGSYVLPTGSRATSSLPIGVMEWAGMWSPHGAFSTQVDTDDFGGNGALTGKNDILGWDFKRIAAFIREKWELL